MRGIAICSVVASMVVCLCGCDDGSKATIADLQSKLAAESTVKAALQNDVKALTGPLTRIEFQIRRQWLRRQGVNEWSDDWAAALWPKLTKWFRMTDRKADTTHQQRCKTWRVWESIQKAGQPAEQDD